MRGILAACAAAVLAVGTAAAEDKKIDPAKLVGKWEMTKSDDPEAPKGATVEFTKDNKVTVVADFNGKKLELTGTYKVDGDKLSAKIKSPDTGQEMEDTDTIKELSDDKLVLVDKRNKETTFVKKK